MASRSPPAQKGGVPAVASELRIKAEVQITDPERMMDRLEEAISEAALGIWLQRDVQDYMGESIAQRFGLEGDKASGDWAELSDATVAMREFMGFSSDEINIRTGDLFRWVTETSKLAAGPGFVELIIPGDSTDPILDEKLKTAQQGRATNPIPNFGPTPPRPVLATDEDDLMEILVMLSEHITMWMAGIGPVTAVT